jgi:hypothetical protein
MFVVNRGLGAASIEHGYFEHQENMAETAPSILKALEVVGTGFVLHSWYLHIFLDDPDRPKAKPYKTLE